MRSFSLLTAWVFHVVLTAVLLTAVVYGEYTAIKAFPRFDLWLAQFGDWVLVAMFAVAYVVGRTASFHFVSRVVLPWLDSNHTGR